MWLRAQSRVIGEGGQGAEAEEVLSLPRFMSIMQNLNCALDEEVRQEQMSTPVDSRDCWECADEQPHRA